MKKIFCKNKNGRGRISVRLGAAFMGILFAVLVMFFVIGIATIGINGKVWEKASHINGIAMIVLVFFAFVYVTNKMLVRRIKNLNSAVSDIAAGNFDSQVEVKGNDELAELAENFNKMIVELKANAFLSKDFARYVSHEFKTPLSVIRSYAETLQANGKDDNVCEYAAVIIAEADRLTEMSKSILELCRLDSTTLIEKNDAFSPAAQVRSALLGAQAKWCEKNINISPELDDFEIVGNESLTFRIWQNLIGNAVKFTQDGGNVNITLKSQDGSCVFVIADDGIGIADEDKNKIYDMFFTGDKSHNKEGSGLGLTLTKTIVEKLGGEISFVSERGKGTTFTVRLPMGTSA